jgi:hypothetical protein
MDITVSVHTKVKYVYAHKYIYINYINSVYINYVSTKVNVWLACIYIYVYYIGIYTCTYIHMHIYIYMHIDTLGHDPHNIVLNN